MFSYSTSIAFPGLWLALILLPLHCCISICLFKLAIGLLVFLLPRIAAPLAVSLPTPTEFIRLRHPCFVLPFRSCAEHLLCTCMPMIARPMLLMMRSSCSVKGFAFPVAMRRVEHQVLASQDCGCSMRSYKHVHTIRATLLHSGVLCFSVCVHAVTRQAGTRFTTSRCHDS